MHVRILVRLFLTTFYLFTLYTPSSEDTFLFPLFFVGGKPSPRIHEVFELNQHFQTLNTPEQRIRALKIKYRVEIILDERRNNESILVRNIFLTIAQLLGEKNERNEELNVLIFFLNTLVLGEQL